MYLYYHNGLNPSLRLEVQFNTSSDDPVQVKYFLQIVFGVIFEATKEVYVMLCHTGSDKSNPSTQVVSKLGIVPAIEAHILMWSRTKSYGLLTGYITYIMILLLVLQVPVI